VTVVSEVRDGVSVVRLARSERRNALVPELLTELVEALDAAAELRQPIVLTGSDGAFCPGADLKWLARTGNPAQGVAELVAMHHTAILRLLDARVPTISAIDGIVAGGGLGLALAPDYRIASDRATFTAAYFRLGLTPDGGSSVFLERTIGATRAMELLLTNRKLSAYEALEWGMVNEVVPDAALLDHAIAFARKLPLIPPYTLLKTRQLLDMAQIRHQLQLESVAIRTASRGEVFRQALQAFLEAHPS
jgi:2-(1,2-epoxy-1,2-dihydrophenyl)acetyl-CoA isomerase